MQTVDERLEQLSQAAADEGARAGQLDIPDVFLQRGKAEVHEQATRVFGPVAARLAATRAERTKTSAEIKELTESPVAPEPIAPPDETRRAQLMRAATLALLVLCAGFGPRLAGIQPGWEFWTLATLTAGLVGFRGPWLVYRVRVWLAGTPRRRKARRLRKLIRRDNKLERQEIPLARQDAVCSAWIEQQTARVTAIYHHHHALGERLKPPIRAVKAAA